MKNKVNVLVFLILLSLTFVFTFILPPDETVVAKENRNLETFPEVTKESVLNGTFATEYETYLADQVAFRSSFVALGNYVSDWHFFKRDDDVYITTINDNTGTSDNGKGEEGSFVPINFGSLLVFDDMIVEIYQHDEVAAKYYTDIVNSYAETFKDKANVYSLVAPTQIEFLDDRYATIGSSQKDALEFIEDNLSDDVTFVDVYDILGDAYANGEYIYFRSDHHWTSLGAYYAYREFAKEAGFTPVELSDLEATQIDGFLGYLYKARPTESIAENPDHIIYYEDPNVETNIPFIDKNNSNYGVFIGGDKPYQHFITNADNDKTIIIIKDSYANAFVPFLGADYKNIIVIDPRSYTSTVEEIVAQYDEVDILFVDYVFACSLYDFLSSIETIK